MWTKAYPEDPSLFASYHAAPGHPWPVPVGGPEVATNGDTMARTHGAVWQRCSNEWIQHGAV